MRWPDAVERRALAGAGAAWLGAGLGAEVGGAAIWPAILVTGAVFAVRRAHLVLGLLLVAGTVAGAGAAHRDAAVISAELPAGPVQVIVDVVDEGHGGPAATAVVRPVRWRNPEGWQSWRGPLLAMTGDEPVIAGQRLDVVGSIQSAPARVRGDPVAGRLHADRVSLVGSTGGIVMAAGNAIRSRVRSMFPPDGDQGAALMAGFLIGDTSGVSRRNLDVMRRSGLAHFVAVSGSNVAWFLAGWWVITLPLIAWPRVRAAGAIVGLAVFVVATRWEPSVLRASLMAGGALLGIIAGLPLTGWSALAAAVAGLVLVSGETAVSVGFQLSVAATAGILAGGAMFAGRRPRPFWMALGATVAAQAAVAPLLLLHFGSVPLLAPLANLISAPLVTAATVSGGLGALSGFEPLIRWASFVADLVLGVASVTAMWPQLGLGGFVVVGGLSGAAFIRRLRPAVAVVLSLLIALPAVMTGRPPDVPTAYFLDVGQGDAVLLRDPTGATALIDGGGDPVVLGRALRRHGVRHVDLLVVTHGDDDHAGGLEGILDLVGVGRLWHPDHPDLGATLEELIENATERGIVVEAPAVGTIARAGSIRIEVLGPARRYASQNDGSVVLWVEVERSLLLAGDIERTAQGELEGLRPDVLLVPHHGSGTSDRDWLARTTGKLAIVSVGENPYGHPDGEIIAVLERAGAEIRNTHEEGEIAVELTGSMDRRR